MDRDDSVTGVTVTRDGHDCVTSVTDLLRRSHGHGHTVTQEAAVTRAPADLARDLLSDALVARLASRLGAPRLATRAGRRAAATAERLVIALSTEVARISPAEEAAALEGVRVTRSLRPLVAPEPDDAPGGAT